MRNKSIVVQERPEQKVRVTNKPKKLISTSKLDMDEQHYLIIFNALKEIVNEKKINIIIDRN